MVACSAAVRLVRSILSVIMLLFGSFTDLCWCIFWWLGIVLGYFFFSTHFHFDIFLSNMNKSNFCWHNKHHLLSNSMPLQDYQTHLLPFLVPLPTTLQLLHLGQLQHERAGYQLAHSHTSPLCLVLLLSSFVSLSSCNCVPFKSRRWFNDCNANTQSAKIKPKNQKLV